VGLNISLFPRQTLVSANSAGHVDYYSDPVCIRRFESLAFELQVLGMFGTNASMGVSVETSAELTVSDPLMTGWREVLVFPTVFSAPTLIPIGMSASTLSRYIRAKVQIQHDDTALTFSFIAAARGN